MKLKEIFLCTVGLVVFVEGSAQQDSITVHAKIASDKKNIAVSQEILYHNPLEKDMDTLKILNWISAYKNRNTSLLFRKLEDRKNDLYFAEPNELGKLYDLQLTVNDSVITNINPEDENFFIPLSKSIPKGKAVKINLNYSLQLPDSKFTGYGSNGEKVALKYFFPVTDSFETDPQKGKDYIDIEENQNIGNYWNVLLETDFPASIESNLEKISENQFSGTATKDPEFIISDLFYQKRSFWIEDRETEIVFGYPVKPEELQRLEFFIPLQLNFIKYKTGYLPEKIFISEKFRKSEDFVGISDISFWKFNFQMFTDMQKTDLHYFSILSKNILQQAAQHHRKSDHWLINGLKTYLEIQYLDRFYKNEKLLGKLPENANIFGIKPLKFFHAADLELKERYGLAYQYIMTQNLDQKIGEDFDMLSNFNAMAISHFEMGSIFDFISQKMGVEKFDDYIRNYLKNNDGENINRKEFLDGLSVASGYSSDFIEEFIERKNRVNFKMKRYEKEDDHYHVKIKKNTLQEIPFRIQTIDEDEGKKTYWFDTDKSTETKTYNIPQADAEKIVVNDGYILPEKNFRDNYRYTQGLFSNMKKPKLKLFKDIPNPEYNEIYLNPRFSFNAYDKVLAGLNFKNSSLFEQNFEYSITPYFSTGTGKLTGSGAVTYRFMPAESFFRSLQLGVSGSYFHYDYDLKYRKFSAFAGINFTKNPRSDIGRSFSFSYNFFDKDLNPQMLENNEYQKYNLWNIGYGYADNRIIHEKYVSGNLQWMEDFAKISADAFYRWEFAKDKKISFRFFGGYFLSNNTKNNLFDFGISRVSNYAFSYGLLGQSATSGLLSQQLILAEGGFKSFIGNTANQWITAFNVDSHVWKWFNVYADAGMYKSKHQPADFIWDSGVKVKVIPDFLEVYFPIQSSLGFEPAFKDYGKRIRFTLVLNFSAVTSYFRRGWF